MTQPRARLRMQLLLSLASVLIFLAVLELSVRIVFGVQPQQQRYRLHPDLGWEWTPGYAAQENDHGVDYYLEISAQGLPHSPEYTIPKPANTFRILALGDSVTHGVGIAPEYKFVRLLQTALQQRYPDSTIEVLNGGTDDYGAEQELLWLQQRGLRFEPDLIILTVYMNDGRPLERSNAITTSSFNLLMSRSAAYYYYSQAVRGLLIQQEMTQADFRFRYKDDFNAGAWINDPGALTELIRAADQDWGLAWTEAGMAAMQDSLAALFDFVESRDIPLLVSLTPVAVQVQAEVEPTGSIGDLEQPQRELAAFTEARGVPLVDLLPMLRAHRSEALFFDQAHYTIAGHALVAQALLAALDEHALLP